MGIRDRLRRLDERALPPLRQPDESAEAFLRRMSIANVLQRGNWIDIQAALQEYFAHLDARG